MVKETNLSMVKTEIRGNALLIGLDRPDKLNALDEKMVDELHLVLDRATRGEPKVLVIHSLVAGAFVSGADISELIERDADSAMRSINAGLFEKFEKFRWPTIAVVDGYALGGGCELALACDFRLASPGSRFGQPELGLGILAGAGGNWRLPQVVGLPVARRMLYGGAVLDAAQALSAQLVDAVHPSERILDASLEFAENIAKRSWRALELTKIALRSNNHPSTSMDVIAQALLFESDEKNERMGKFLKQNNGGKVDS